MRYVKQAAFAFLVQARENVQFQLAQFTVGDDKKVSAATSGIEKFQAGDFLMKFEQPLFALGLVF